MRVRDLLNAAGRKDPASVRMLASAHASHEELYPAQAHRRGSQGRRRRVARARGVAPHREAAAGQHQVPRARDRRAQRQRREGSRPRRHRQARRRRRPVGAAAPRSIRAASRCSTSSIRARMDRWATCRGSIEARKSGRLPSLDLPGRAADRAGEDRRRGAARLRVGREGRDLHQRPGHGAGGVEGDQRARRIGRGLADPHQRRRPRLACPTPTPRSQQVRADVATHLVDEARRMPT